MQTRLILRPGEKGTRRLAAHYGDRLVCVRYRYDADARKRFKTVELIVAEAEWEPHQGLPDLPGASPGEREVHPPDPTGARVSPPGVGPETLRVKVAWGEKELRERVRQAGGRWDPGAKVWLVGRSVVEELRLEGRVQDGVASPPPLPGK